MEGEFEIRKSSSRKGRWGAGHSYSKATWGCEVMEEIYIKSDDKSQMEFVADYLKDHSEVGNWDSTGHVSYTVNKRKRWLLTKGMKNIFEEDMENLEQKPYRVVVVERDVIKKHCDKQRPELAMNVLDSKNLPVPWKKNTQKMKGHPLTTIRKGELNGKTHLESLVDVSSLSNSSHPQVVYEAWQVQPRTKHLIRGDKSVYTYTPWRRSYGQPISSRERKKQNAVSAKECIKGGMDEFSNDLVENRHNGIHIDHHFTNKKDTYNNTEYDFKSNAMNISLQDIIGKKNSLRKRIHERKITDNQDIHSKKGKMIYDPNFIPNETYNLNEEFGEPRNNNPEEDNWMEKLEEDARIIVFLDVTDILLTVPVGWRRFKSTTEPYRVMLEHFEGGVIILIEIRQSVDFGSAECALTVMNLCGEPFTDILDVFSSMSSVQEIANAAVSLCSTIKKNDYLETEDYVIVRESLAHLSMKQSPVPPTLSHPLPPTPQCGICFSHLDEGVSLSCLKQCGHSFCSSCWQYYLMSQVKDGQSNLTCPAYLCSSPVDLPTTAWYLGVEYYKLFLRLIVTNQVSRDKRYIWCPKPSCGRVIFLKNPDVNHIQCLCRHQWCPKCREESHWPASCKDKADFKAYKYKMEEYKQLESNVKVRACPRCHTLWEKMYGCNHMACTCGAHFCWGCGQEHIGTMGYACGGMKVPLESVNIVPLPTEKFSMRRIKAFQMAEKLNKRTALSSGSTTRNFEIFSLNSTSQDRDTEVLVHRFLSVDKKEYFENLGKGIISFQQSPQYLITKDVLSKATAILKQGQFVLTNAFTMPQSTKETNSARLSTLVAILEQLSIILYKSKLTRKNADKQVEKIIKMTKEIDRGILRYNKLK